MTDLELHVIMRLRELQNGADPINEYAGICYDIYIVTCFNGFTKIFKEMGLHPVYPIGNDCFVRRWHGKRGVERRAFAGRVADFMEGKK